MPERLAIRVPVKVCEDGHAVPAANFGVIVRQITCWRCSGWTWADGNFCVGCGAQLKATDQ